MGEVWPAPLVVCASKERAAPADRVLRLPRQQRRHQLSRARTKLSPSSRTSFPRRPPLRPARASRSMTTRPLGRRARTCALTTATSRTTGESSSPAVPTPASHSSAELDERLLSSCSGACSQHTHDCCVHLYTSVIIKP